MMPAKTTAALLVAVLASSATAASVESELQGSNPIRKVVTMLQDMQKTVESEGKKEEDLFDKFMCYCSGGEGALEASITQGKTQIEQDLKTHKSDRSAAEATIKESTAMREKEAAEFAATSGDMKSNIASMAGALDALKKGLSAALLQTSTGNVLRNIISHSPAVRPSQRSLLMSFLKSGSSEQGGSDTIIGVVEQMKETMEADLAETEKSEAESKSTYETLMTTKKGEIEAAGKAIETKSARTGSVAVEVVQDKADLEKTTKAVEEDTDFKRNLAGACATKQKEWDARQKIRAEEVAAISDTIEMLNGDDALELFKKTMPSAAALIQTSTATRSQMRRAKSLIDKAMGSDKGHAVNRHLILAALKSGTGGFEKVNTMIDGMNEVLEGEQVADDKQDVWCLAELDKAKDEAKATEEDVGDLSAAIDDQRDKIAGLGSEIEAIKKGLEDLDKSVAEATEQRKDEHSDYIDEAASNQAAVDLLGMAKNRLNKFYNPTLYKEPEPVAEEEFFSQIAVTRADPGAPPETFGEYKKSESSSGVINMIDEMIEDMKDERKGQLEVLEDKIDNLHKTCDFLIAQYAAIKEARIKEEEGLKTAKSVLAGANFGFMQK